MTGELAGWLAIGGMALVTYLTRVGGFLAFAGVSESGPLRRALDQLPGATFAALVVPRLVESGPAEWSAAAVLIAMLMLWRRGGPLAALLGYLGALALWRLIA